MHKPLDRFLNTQGPGKSALRRSRGIACRQKKTHWIWFIFPQIEGLGHSEMAKRYAIQDRDEAVDDINHPQLAERLSECTQMLIDSRAGSARDILGTPDDLKLLSSKTLFESASNESPTVSTDVLDRFFNTRCGRTLVCLSNT